MGARQHSLARRSLRWMLTADGLAALAAYGFVGGALALGLLMLAGVVEPERSAHETVRRFYLAASTGDWEEARGYLSAGALAALDEAGDEGPARVLPAGGDDGGIISVSSISVSLEEARTRATVRVVLEGAPPEEGAGRTMLDVRRESLVRQGGAWLLACPGALECRSP